MKGKEILKFSQHAPITIEKKHPHHRNGDEGKITHLIRSSDTTLTLSKVFQDPEGKTHCLLVNAGDSRIYLRREGVFTCLTRDHGIGQTLVELGVIRNEVDISQAVPSKQVKQCLETYKQMARRALDGPIDQQELLLIISLLSALANAVGVFDEQTTDGAHPYFLPLEEFSFRTYASLGYSDHIDCLHVSTFPVRDGDELYAFTDGIFENLTPEALNLLRNLAPATDINSGCEGILKEIRKRIFYGEEPYKDDDLTAIGMRLQIK